MAETVVLIISIDTEEDNWEPASERITVENIRELPRLDRRFERLGARATYFTTYQVAATDWAAGIIRGLGSTGRAEIGAHLHPWNTPPVDAALRMSDTMLGNLSPETQRQKIHVLTDALTAAVGRRPTSFRVGRWALDAGAADSLIACGYRVDSSVTPFKSWRADYGPSHVGAPLNVYRIGSRRDHRVHAANGPLIEVPTSWGYTQRRWPLTQRINRGLELPMFRRLDLQSVAARLHMINHVVLSPEIDAIADMVVLVRRLLSVGVRHLHLTFHSSSLRPGLNPFARTSADVDRFYMNLATMIDRIGSMTPLRFATVGEAAALLAPPVRP